MVYLQSPDDESCMLAILLAVQDLANQQHMQPLHDGIVGWCSYGGMLWVQPVKQLDLQVSQSVLCILLVLLLQVLFLTCSQQQVLQECERVRGDHVIAGENQCGNVLSDRSRTHLGHEQGAYLSTENGMCQASIQ